MLKGMPPSKAWTVAITRGVGSTSARRGLERLAVVVVGGADRGPAGVVAVGMVGAAAVTGRGAEPTDRDDKGIIKEGKRIGPFGSGCPGP